MPRVPFSFLGILVLVFNVQATLAWPLINAVLPYLKRLVGREHITIPTDHQIQMMSNNDTRAGWERHCPWCSADTLLIPEPAENYTTHCQLVVTRPIDDAYPLDEFIEVAVLSHDFKYLRGMVMPVPWGKETDIIIGLPAPYRPTIGKVTVRSGRSVRRWSRDSQPGGFNTAPSETDDTDIPGGITINPWAPTPESETKSALSKRDLRGGDPTTPEPASEHTSTTPPANTDATPPTSTSKSETTSPTRTTQSPKPTSSPKTTQSTKATSSSTATTSSASTSKSTFKSFSTTSSLANTVIPPDTEPLHCDDECTDDESGIEIGQGHDTNRIGWETVSFVTETISGEGYDSTTTITKNEMTTKHMFPVPTLNLPTPYRRAVRPCCKRKSKHTGGTITVTATVTEDKHHHKHHKGRETITVTNVRTITMTADDDHHHHRHHHQHHHHHDHHRHHHQDKLTTSSPIVPTTVTVPTTIFVTNFTTVTPTSISTSQFPVNHEAPDVGTGTGIPSDGGDTGRLQDGLEPPMFNYSVTRPDGGRHISLIMYPDDPLWRGPIGNVTEDQRFVVYYAMFPCMG
ncbi:hypothetical protein V8F20_008796 [Naviculisporaceae sp. PSN 640]